LYELVGSVVEEGGGSEGLGKGKKKKEKAKSSLAGRSQDRILVASHELRKIAIL